MATDRRIRRSAGSALCAIALTVATAAALLALLPTTAGAVGEAAVTVKGTPCSMAGSDANGKLDDVDGGTGVVALKVENGNNVVLKCTAAPGTLKNLSGRTQVYRGFQCFIKSPVDGITRFMTYDSNATVTANGGGQVTCKYSKP
jgi:hypothetical protein